MSRKKENVELTSRCQQNLEKERQGKVSILSFGSRRNLTAVVLG